MNLQSRNQYLHALGIEVWYSRESSALDGIDSAEEPSAVTKEPSAVTKEPSAAKKEPSATTKEPSAAKKESAAPTKKPTVPPMQPLKDISRELDLKPEAMASTAAEVLPPAAVAAPEKRMAPHFCIAWVRLADNCIAMFDAEPGSSALPTEEQALAANLLKAVGLPLQGLHNLQFFQWPMIAQPHIDQSEDVAREALAALFKPQMQMNSGHVLLLGETAAGYIRPVLSDVGIKAIELVSLKLMLSRPELKSEAWRQLQDLLKVSWQVS